MSLPDRQTCGTCGHPTCTGGFPHTDIDWCPDWTKEEDPMLPDRDPAVAVELTPDAERITAECEALVLDYRPPKDRDDDDGLRQVLARLFRTRAESGQLKHGPMAFWREFRNPFRQMRQEMMDKFWYFAMGEAFVDFLLAKVDAQDKQIAHLTAEVERLRTRIADLERERDRMLPVFEAAKAWHEGYVNALTEAEWRQERLALRDAVETATQEARHD